MTFWLFFIFLGTEAVRRGQLLETIPVVGDNNLAPASLPRLLQQLLYTPKEEFQVPGARKDPETSAPAANSISTLETVHSVTSTNDPIPSEHQEKVILKNNENSSTQLSEKSSTMTSKSPSLVEETSAYPYLIKMEDPYLIKIPKPPTQDIQPPITGDNCTDEKIRIDRRRLKELEKEIDNRENEKRLHFQWIETAQNSIEKVQKQINQTHSSVALIDRSIKNLEQEKIMVLNKMRKDELAYSLEEARASLKKLHEQSRGTEQEKEELGSQKLYVQERLEKIASSLKELQKDDNQIMPLKQLQEGSRIRQEHSVGTGHAHL